MLHPLADYETIDQVPQRAYKIHEDFQTWKAAHDICKSEGAHLATVDKPKIHDWFSKYAEEYLWIGAKVKEVN